MSAILNRAKADWQKITGDPNQWGTSINFEAPSSETATVHGLATKHHIGIDTDGNLVDTKNAHISVSEQLLIDASYPVRDSNDEVNLENHKVTFSDNRGVSFTYMIRQWHPDETLGVILCILDDFE